MWEEHTRLMTQLVTLMRVSVVLFTGLRGEPTAKHERTVKPETRGVQEDLGCSQRILGCRDPAQLHGNPASIQSRGVAVDFREHEAAFPAAASLSYLLWLG